MSCFLVSEDHLRVVSAAIVAPPYLSWMWKGKERKAPSRTDIARMLRKENVRSMCFRYEDMRKSLRSLLREASSLDVFKGGVANFQDIPPSARIVQNDALWLVDLVQEKHSTEVVGVSIQRRGQAWNKYTAVQCMKLIESLMYQCTEHDAWPKSEAYAMLTEACAYYARVAIHYGVRDVYDSAAWSI